MSRWTGWEPIDVAGLDAALQPMGTGRGAELHLGQIVKAMKIAAGEKVGDILGEQPWLRAQCGFLWEQAVEYTLAGMGFEDAMELAFKRMMRALRTTARQTKLERDGIHMTPDGIDKPLRLFYHGNTPITRDLSALVPEFTTPGCLLYSWKLTWRGAGKAGFGMDPDEGLAVFEDNFWTWHVAEKAYAAAAQTAGLLPPGDATCRFEALFVRGDYKGAGGPKALATEVTWTAEELDSNWQVVLKNAAGLR